MSGFLRPTRFSLFGALFLPVSACQPFGLSVFFQKSHNQTANSSSDVPTYIRAACAAPAEIDFSAKYEYVDNEMMNTCSLQTESAKVVERQMPLTQERLLAIQSSRTGFTVQKVIFGKEMVKKR